MTDTATLKTRLTEAETAYHDLLLGKTVQVAGHEGRSVTFTPARAADLQAYIANLKQQLGIAPRRAFGIGIR